MASLVGCGDDGRRAVDRPDDVLWSSEHFDYWTRAAEATACEGVLTTLERHRTVIMGYLGLPASNERITYRKYVDASDLETVGACPRSAVACEHSKIIESSDVLQQHELIHAYLDGWGSAPPLFAEGVAEALACEGAIAWKPAPVDWRELGVGTALDVYGPGRWFVGHLLHVFGPEPFLRVYQGDWFFASNEEIQSRFMSVYGRALDDLWQEAFAASSWSICARVWECASPPIGIAGEAIDLTERCDGGGKHGTVTVDAPALLDLQGGGNLSIQRCGDGGPNINPPGSSQRILAELEPGTVFLTTTWRDPPWRATLGPPIPAGAACPIVSFPLTPAESLTSWTFAVRAPSGPLLLALATPIDAELTRLGDASNGGAPESANVELCTDCSASSCAPLPPSWARFAVGALRIQAATPAPDGFVYVRLGVRPPATP